MNFKNKQLPFILTTVCAVLALIVPSLVQQGMFMDGVQYAIVSKNLAVGKGSFWLPFLCDSWNRHGVNYFLEHPPLVYFLQSYFFKIFGTDWYTEKLYSGFTFIICAYLIHKIWQHLFINNIELKKLSWLPILIWLIIPQVYWSFANNLHENTVSIFVLGSVFFSLKSITNTKFYHIFISAIFIFCATLSKGLPGLFPILFFIVYRFCYSTLSTKKNSINTLILIGVPIALYVFICLLSNDALFSLNFYIKNRLLDRLTNDHLVDYRLTIIWWLFTELLVPFILIFLIFMFLGIKQFLNPETSKLKSDILFFSLLGLVGVIPLSFTFVQRAVYFVPAVPFLAIALSLVLANGINSLTKKINNNTITFKSIVCIIILIYITLLIYDVTIIGKIGRDKNDIDEAQLISNKIGLNSKLIVKPETYTNWAFQFYLLRNHNISISCNSNYSNYYLYKKNSLLDSSLNYKKLNFQSSAYNLYEATN